MFVNDYFDQELVRFMLGPELTKSCDFENSQICSENEEGTSRALYFELASLIQPKWVIETMETDYDKI